MSRQGNDINLFAPMHLNALLVTGPKDESEKHWKEVQIDYRRAMNRPQFGLGGRIEKRPEWGPELNPHKAGIHLHWILPAAFRQGVQTEKDKAPVFPLIPNRWLIMRTFYPQESGKDPVTSSWVVESDAQKEKGIFNWMEVEENDDHNTELKPRALGQKYSAEKWEEKRKEEKQFLTIAAPGNPAFAAYYSSCKDMLGFHDPMDEYSDIAGSCSYLVAGWCANPNADILGGADQPGEIESKLKALSWEINAPDMAAIPERVICHAFVYNLAWPGKNKKTGFKIPTEPVKISIGNSAIEALAVALSQKTKSAGGHAINGLLSVLQYGLLSKYQSSNGFDILQEQFHSRGFHSINGGGKWIIERKEKDISGPDSKEHELEAPKPFPSDISGFLRELNEKQKEYDQAQRLLKSRQLRLYTHWYRWRFGGARGNFEKAELIEDIKNGKESIVKLLDPEYLRQKSLEDATDIPENFSGAAGEIPEIFKKLSQSLQEEKHNSTETKIKYRDYLIKEVPAPPFYIPNDPALVLSGLAPSDVYKPIDTLPCRLDSQLVNTVNYATQLNGNSLTVEFGQDDVPAGCTFPMNDYLPGGLENLFAEWLLLDPAMAKCMAKKTFENVGENYGDKEDGDLAKAIRKRMGQTGNDDDAFLHNSQKAQLPSQAFLDHSAWEQPWVPLFLEWVVDWYPITTDSPSGAWRFGKDKNNTDYEIDGEPLKFNSLEKTYSYSGRIPMGANLEERIQDLSESFPFIDTLVDLKNITPLFQTLSGLNDHFISRESGLQFPPLLKRPGTSTYSIIDQELLKIVGDQYHLRPTTKDAYPTRGGYFRIKTLRIIDAFSQVKEMDAKDIKQGLTVANNIKKEQWNNETYLQLPVRLIQPTRLSCSWLSAENGLQKTDSDPGSSPICGWLLPIYLDNALLFFDAKGKACGKFKRTGSSGPFYWEDAPGMERNEQETSIDKGPLGKLMKGLQELPKEDKAEACQDLLKLIFAVNSKIDSKTSSRHFSPALPIGHPVALVRAFFRLESAEIPMEGVKEMDFPLRLGDMRKAHDGLLGYFVGEDYSKMFLSFANGYMQAGNYFVNQQTEHIKITGPGSSEHEVVARSMTCTLLMDPRMDVQVNIGILPQQTISLPPHWTEEALKNIELDLPINPLLTSRDVIVLPLPGIKDKKWTWISSTRQKVEKPEKLNEKANKEKKKWDQFELDPKANIDLSFQPLQVVEGWLKVGNEGKKEDKNKS
jgi:hypothetical protein